jgi:hypothetical protein
LSVQIRDQLFLYTDPAVSSGSREVFKVIKIFLYFVFTAENIIFKRGFKYCFLLCFRYEDLPRRRRERGAEQHHDDQQLGGGLLGLRLRLLRGTLIKKKRKFSSYIKEIQMGAVAKSNMRKGFLIPIH